MNNALPYRFRTSFWAMALLGAAIAFPSLSLASSGTEGAAFLDIPVGAGPASLGGAYTALAADAYAPTWNPAGLGFLESDQLAGQHLSYLESLHYEHLSFVHPLHKGRAWGVSAQYLGSGDIPERNVSDELIGTYSSHYGAYTFSYGQKLGEALSLGMSAKLINAALAEVSANAFAVDLGALYKLSDRLTLGSTLTNLGTPLTFISQKDSLPLALHVGASFKPARTWMFSGEVVYPKTGLASAHLGAEWRPISMIGLRAGYRTDTTKELGAMAGLTTGIGIDVWGHEFSYAWLPFGDLGNTHYLSFVMRFGEAARAKRHLIQYKSLKKHTTVKGRSGAESGPYTEPEYQMLMQLLSERDQEWAARPHTEDATR